MRRERRVRKEMGDGESEEGEGSGKIDGKIDGRG